MVSPVMASRVAHQEALTDELTSIDLQQLSDNTLESVNQREFRFVEPFPEEVQIECSICFQILKDPQIMTCCGYRFCQECIKRVTHACPLCKEAIQYFPDKTLTRQINQRRVYCLLKKDGCSWMGELSKVRNHLDFNHQDVTPTPCQFLPVPCEFCEEYVRRKDMEGHRARCLRRPLKCKFCGSSVRYGLLNHYKNCIRSPVKCTNLQCTEYLTRNDIDTHLDSCGWSIVECKFKHAGCYSRIYRRKMEDHLEQDMKYHLELLSKKCDSLQIKEIMIESEMKALDDKVKGLEKELQDKGRIQFLVISDLPDDALEEQKIKSRFGQYGSISDIELYPSKNAGIVVYSSSESYQKVMDSRARGIRLCKGLLQVNPVYTKNEEDSSDEDSDLNSSDSSDW